MYDWCLSLVESMWIQGIAYENRVVTICKLNGRFFERFLLKHTMLLTVQTLGKRPQIEDPNRYYVSADEKAKDMVEEFLEGKRER